MNNIIYDDEIITPENDKYQYYYDFLNRLEQRDCVKFALFCAKIVNSNTKESNLCIGLVEKWLVDANSVDRQELWAAAYSAWYIVNIAADVNISANATYISVASHAVASAYTAAYSAAFAANSVYSATSNAAYTINSVYSAASNAAYTVNFITSNINIINKYLQILLRKTKQFQNNKILEQISKTDVDRLELVDCNMITDIMQEEYNIVHEFDYSDIFGRRCLIELLRGEYA